MGLGFAPTWLRQVSPPASHDQPSNPAAVGDEVFWRTVIILIFGSVQAVWPTNLWVPRPKKVSTSAKELCSADVCLLA